MDKNNETITHALKTDREVFEAVITGVKNYEMRVDDRDPPYRVGDCLYLRETEYTGAQMRQGRPLIYTRRAATRTITHILRGPVYGLVAGWIIMSTAQ
jgi:hypothetical protein